MHCLRKGGVGGAQLTWDCCKAFSTVSGCASRGSGVFNTNYELCNPPKVATIASWLASLKLLRQRIEAHAKYLDGAGPVPMAMSPEEKERHHARMRLTLCALTLNELYNDAREDARIVLRLFNYKLIPSVTFGSSCTHRRDE